MTDDILSPIPLFAPLTEAERKELAGLMRSRQFKAHETIVWIGDRGHDFYLVRSGKVAASCPDESGEEVLLAVLGPGQFFGEISLLDGGPRTATVRAQTDTELLDLGRDEFLQFLRRHPDAAIHVLTILGQRQRDMLGKMRGIPNANQAIAATLSRWHAIAAKVAAAIASHWFVGSNIVFIGLWVITNVLLKSLGRQAFDELPFGLLEFIITAEALFIALFVLINQGQQADRDRIRADLDYDVSVKAHKEVMELHQKVDRMQPGLAKREDNPVGDETEQVG